MLVVIGVNARGEKHFVAIEDGVRESTQSGREVLLTFYDFPAAHWAHLRTTNVIESAFATIRHRGSRAKGCVTRYCFLPLYAFCGRQLLVAYLRPSNIDAARHTWAILSLLVKGLRQAWPGVRTELLQ